jgi:hypothetical protein
MPNSCPFRPPIDTHPSDASLAHIGLIYLVILQGVRQNEFPDTLNRFAWVFSSEQKPRSS